MDRVYYNQNGDITKILREFPFSNINVFESGYTEEKDGYVDSNEEIRNVEDFHVADGVVIYKNPNHIADLEAEVAKQIAINLAQEKVNKRLGKTLDMVITFLVDKFSLDASEQSFIDSISTFSNVKTALNNLLTISPEGLKIASDYHADFTAWRELNF